MNNKIIPKQVPVINYEKWYNKLPLDKQLYIANMVKRKLDKIHADTTEIIDSCYIGAMIEEKEMSLDDCVQVAKKANVNMHETFKKLDSEGEKYYMRVNNNELRAEIRLEAKAMLKSNPKSSTIDISKELQKNYDLPLKDLHIIVAEARKEIQAEEKEKFCKEVGKENEKILKKEVATDEEVKKEFVVGEEIPKFVNPNKPKLKIISQTIKIQGENDIYIKDSTGVKVGDKFYKDKSIVEEEKSSYLRRMEDKEQELKATIEKLTAELEQRIISKEKAIIRFEELEEVFEI